MGDLSGQDIDRLSRQLMDALNFDDLAIYVHASTGDRLHDEYVPPGKVLRVTIFELLVELQKRGMVALFLRYVYVRKPGKPALRAMIEAMCPDAVAAAPDRAIALSAQQAGKPQQQAPDNALAPGFQRNLMPHLPQLDVRVWSDALIRNERRVCRIELADQGIGTGFLIGPDTVLTNWHVVEGPLGEGKLDQLKCRFDYARLADGSLRPGQLIALHADGLLLSSPYSAAEAANTPDDPPPTADELDFAVLRLATRAGEQQVDGQPRGCIVLPQAPVPVPVDAPILIMQHPKGEPIKLALDTRSVIELTPSGTRLRYRTNTEHGSSGSPCFSMDWSIVALHHYGDPDWLKPTFNQGVPIHLVRKRIEARGFGGALGM